MDTTFLDRLKYRLDEISKADCKACIQGELVKLQKLLKDRFYISHYDQNKEFHLSFQITDVQSNTTITAKHRNCVLEISYAD